MKKFIFILVIGIFSACQDIENCDTNDEWRFIVVSFFSIEDNTPKAVDFSFTAENSPYIYSFLADTTITDGDTTIVSDSTFILLPLNPETTTTTFFFDSDTASYMIEFSYDLQVSIFDEGCPPSISFMNLDTVRYSFDSLSIPGRITNRLIETNVEVFL